MKVAIFDKDGTLVDIKKTWGKIMKARVDLFTKRLTSYVGKLNREEMKKEFIKEIDNIFDEVDKCEIAPVPIKKNIQLLKRLHKQGYRIVIATYDNFLNTLYQLSFFGIYKMTSQIVAPADKKKLAIADCEKLLVIGDSQVDKDMAKRLGAKFICA